MGGSLFSSQNNQQQNQQPQNSLFGASGSGLLNTSMNQNPYGNDSLFAGLATPTQSPGPLATPLSSSQRQKKPSILSQSQLNPAANLRLVTPQGKRTGRGYGFSYSTYGTPSSVSSNSSPGFGGSLFAGGNSLSRTLGKSLSTSNLRNGYTAESSSILSPGAFSVTNRGYGGSLKKLNVNRNLNTRIPLFDEPPQKRVSFAAGGRATRPTVPRMVRLHLSCDRMRTHLRDLSMETPETRRLAQPWSRWVAANSLAYLKTQCSRPSRHRPSTSSLDKSQSLASTGVSRRWRS